MDFGWTDEQLARRRAALDFARVELTDDELATRDREGRFSPELWARCARFGLLRLSVPAAQGGEELDLPTAMLIMEGLGEGCADNGLTFALNAQLWTVQRPIARFGSAEQRDRFLPGMADGRLIGAHALTEPDAGSDAFSLTTRAERRGDGYVLNGVKHLVTLAPLADVALVFAVTNPAAGKWGISGFLVERGTPGFTATDQHGKLSLRASVTSELGFADCRIPADAVLPKTEGLKNALMCLNQARYGIAWGGLGAAMDCYVTALEYAKQRKQFAGQPIASHQLVQEKLVWMLSEITKGQLLALQLGRLKDSGRLKHQHVSLGKRNNVWVARECSKLAREILGANGIVDDYPVMRHMMNIESVYTYEGTHDVHGLVLGEAITGIPSFNPPMPMEKEPRPPRREEPAAAAAEGVR